MRASMKCAAFPDLEKNLPCIAIPLEEYRKRPKSTRVEKIRSYDPSMNYDAVLFDAAETWFTTRGSVGDIYYSVAQRYGTQASAAAIQLPSSPV